MVRFWENDITAPPSKEKKNALDDYSIKRDNSLTVYYDSRSMHQIPRHLIDIDNVQWSPNQPSNTYNKHWSQRQLSDLDKT